MVASAREMPISGVSPQELPDYVLRWQYPNKRKQTKCVLTLACFTIFISETNCDNVRRVSLSRVL